MENHATILVGGLVGGCLLWIAYFKVWVPSLLSIYRQDLFRIREQLFLDAAEGRISFDDPIYGMLRAYLNAALRQSQSLTIVSFILALLTYPCFRDRELTLADKVHDCIETMKDEEKKNIYQARLDEFFHVSALHVVRRYQIPFIGALIVGLLLRTYVQGAQTMLNWWSGAVARLVEIMKNQDDDLRQAGPSFA